MVSTCIYRREVLLLLLLAKACFGVFERIFDATEHGVIGNGLQDDTVALQNLIDSVPPHSVVFVPLGRVVVTGPLTLKNDDFTLQIDGRLQAWDATAAVLKDVWPRLPPLPTYGDSRDAGQYMRYQALIYASGLTNLRITGSGTIDGRGQRWWDAMQHNRSLLWAGRPNLIQIVNSSWIEIDSVELRDAPFWTLHPVLSRNVHIHHVTIRAPLYALNVDGIDPEYVFGVLAEGDLISTIVAYVYACSRCCIYGSCRNVMIEYVDVACGDDHIAIKAGVCGESSPNNCTDPVWSSGTAYQTDNVTVRHSTFGRGMGIAVGSEMSGSVTNVHIYNNTIGVCDEGPDPDRGCGWGPALHVKTTIARGGRLENITFSNNTVWNTSMFLSVEMAYQTIDGKLPDGYEPTVIRNIFFISNLALGSATAATFACSQYDACHGITVVDNLIVNAAAESSPWHCQFIATDFVVEGNVPSGLEECMSASMNSTATTPSHLHLPALSR